MHTHSVGFELRISTRSALHPILNGGEGLVCAIAHELLLGVADVWVGKRKTSKSD